MDVTDFFSGDIFLLLVSDNFHKLALRICDLFFGPFSFMMSEGRRLGFPCSSGRSEFSDDARSIRFYEFSPPCSLDFGRIFCSPELRDAGFGSFASSPSRRVFVLLFSDFFFSV